MTTCIYADRCPYRTLICEDPLFQTACVYYNQYKRRRAMYQEDEK